MHKNTEVHLQLRWGVLSLGIRDVEYKEPLSPRGTALPQPEVFPRWIPQTVENIPQIFRRMAFDDREIKLGSEL